MENNDTPRFMKFEAALIFISLYPYTKFIIIIQKTSITAKTTIILLKNTVNHKGRSY